MGDSSKRGLTLGVGIWIFKISSMSSVLFFVIVKVYEIAMVFSFLCFLVSLLVMVKQWILIWLWEMWYYVSVCINASLIISFASFGIYGSYGGRVGFQCVVRNLNLRLPCVGVRWLDWEPACCNMIIYICVWPYCRHAPRTFTWDDIREVGTLDSKVGIWMVRSCYKDHERIGQLWWWLLRLWRWDECGMMRRLVENNGWYNVESSIENYLRLMKFQVFMDYERFHTSGRLGYIIKWMVVKIWICLQHILAFLVQIPNRGYKELGNKVICSAVIESGVLFYLEISIIWCIQLVNFLNFGLTKWKRDVDSRYFVGIFKPIYSGSKEQSNFINI